MYHSAASALSGGGGRWASLSLHVVSGSLPLGFSTSPRQVVPQQGGSGWVGFLRASSLVFKRAKWRLLGLLVALAWTRHSSLPWQFAGQNPVTEAAQAGWRGLTKVWTLGHHSQQRQFKGCSLRLGQPMKSDVSFKNHTSSLNKVSPGRPIRFALEFWGSLAPRGASFWASARLECVPCSEHEGGRACPSPRPITSPPSSAPSGRR